MGQSISLQNGDIYDGCVNFDKKPHCSGKVVYDDNKYVYEGQFANGRTTGNGKAGQVKDDQGLLLKGFYTQRYLNLGVYEGNYVNGQRNGQGRMIYVNNDVYEGGYVNDKCEGIGKHTYHNGNVAKAEWKNNMWNGYLVLTYPNGDSLEGFCKNHKANGIFLSKRNGDCFVEIYNHGVRTSSKPATPDDVQAAEARRPQEFKPLPHEPDKNGNYICRCYGVFVSKEDYKVHKKTCPIARLPQDTPENALKFACQVCNMNFNTLKEKATHELMAHPENEQDQLANTYL